MSNDNFLQENVKCFIDNTIIATLKSQEKYIFEGFITIEEIRSKLLQMVKSVKYEDLSERGVVGYWNFSEGNLVIDSGNFNIKTGDDGIHAEYINKINNGNITIEKCY